MSTDANAVIGLACGEGTLDAACKGIWYDCNEDLRLQGQLEWMKSSLGAWNRATQDSAAPDLPRQQKFLFNIDLAFGYLQSDQFMSATPPGDKQLHDQRGRTSKIPEEQP